jgi:hypothetical protein
MTLSRLPGLTARLAGQSGVNGIVSPRSSHHDQKQVIGQARGEHVRTMTQLGELTSRWQDWPARRLAARKRELGTTVSW